MKRLTVGLIVLLLVMAGGLVAQQVTVLKVKVQSANVRAEPDMNAAVVRQVKLGTLLESKQKVGEWFEVTITDERGNAISAFINATVVDVVTGGEKPAGQAGAQQAEVKKPGEQGAPVIIVQQQVQQAQANNQTQTNIQTQNAAGDSGLGGAAGGGFKVMGGVGLANGTIETNDAQAQTLYDKYRTSKMVFAGGIGVAMGSRIGFEFDLLYLQKGVRLKGTDTSTGESISFDASMLANTISLPVLLKFNILNSPSAPALYVMGGGEIAYILDAKLTYSVTQGGQTQTGTEKVEKDNMNQIDYGAVFGGGIGINFGGTQIFLEGRYHLGMANLMKNANGTQIEGADNFKPKSQLLLVMAGFKF
jgi:hypothetical protein